MSQRRSKDTAVKSRFGSLSDVTKSGFISLMDRNILEDIAASRAANDAGDVRTDVFSDSSGVDGTLSSGQTVRPTPDFDVIATPGASLDLFRPSDLSNGLQGFWKLDETSGNRTDSSGNSNTLTDNNTVASSDDDYWNTLEKSADFESTNSESLSITDASQTGLDVTTAYSACSWIKLESVGIAQRIIDKTAGGATGYEFSITTGNVLRIVNGGNVAASTVTLVAGKWYHVAVTYDGVFATFYINGNAEPVSFTTNVTDSIQAFTIGATAGGGQHFDGLMKDVAFWNVALTPIQIKSLALGLDLDALGFRPDNSTLTAPTAFWKLNEISAGTGAVSRLDSSGNGHTLTDNGTTPSLEGFIEGAGADFNGTTEFFTAADSADFDFSGGTFSIVAWIRLDSLGSVNTIASQATDGSNYWLFRVNTDGSLEFNAFESSEILAVKTTTSLFSIDTWYHVAITESGDTWTLYIDGIDKTSTGGTDTSRVSNHSNAFGVGANQSLAASYNGRMSDVATWKGTALSAANIASLASGLPIQQEGIISYWKLDEESGTRVDAIGSNDLTDNNSVLFAAGQVDNAADFETDDNDYLSIADASQTGLTFAGRAAYTLLSWTKPESHTGGKHSFFANKGNGSSNAYGMYYANVTRTIVHQRGSILATGTTNVGTGTFDHAACVYDGTNLLAYLNSVQEASTSDTANMVTTANPFVLGTQAVNPGTATDRYDGLLDESLAAARYFREEEIKTVYNKGRNSKEATSSEVSVGGATATVISTEFSLSESPTHALIRVAKTLNTGSITFYVSRVSSPGSTLTDATKWQEISEDTITDLTVLDAGSSGRWAATITGDAELDDIAVVFGRKCI